MSKAERVGVLVELEIQRERETGQKFRQAGQALRNEQRKIAVLEGYSTQYQADLASFVQRTVQPSALQCRQAMLERLEQVHTASKRREAQLQVQTDKIEERMGAKPCSQGEFGKTTRKGESPRAA